MSTSLRPFRPKPGMQIEYWHPAFRHGDRCGTVIEVHRGHLCKIDVRVPGGRITVDQVPFYPTKDLILEYDPHDRLVGACYPSLLMGWPVVFVDSLDRSRISPFVVLGP